MGRTVRHWEAKKLHKEATEEETAAVLPQGSQGLQVSTN